MKRKTIIPCHYYVARYKKGIKYKIQKNSNNEFKKNNYIRKTYLYNFDPLKPHFYTVKLAFTGVYIIFLISA